MILRFSLNFPILLFFSFFTVGLSAEAQESISGNEPEISELPENIIEVEVESFQSKALKNFLQEYRLILQQSKLDTSDVLQKFRKDFANLKKENLRALKTTRQKKFPKVVLKRINPDRDRTRPKTPEPAFFPSDFPGLQKFNAPIAPKQKDKLLSLEERRRLAEIEKKRRQKIRQDKNSELGRLKTEIEQGPLKGHQEKLDEFSGRIKKLLTQIEKRQGDAKTLFLDLGNAYLESQRYLNSLGQEDGFKLTRYALHSGTALGSFELALWTFKMALSRNPNDGATNLLLGKVLSEMGRPERALERARNAEILFAKNRQPEKAAQARSLIKSLSNTSYN